MARTALPDIENHPYPKFQRALIARGKNDKERSVVLDISRETIRGWRMGRVDPKPVTLLKFPDLLAAYLADVADAAAVYRAA